MSEVVADDFVDTFKTSENLPRFDEIVYNIKDWKGEGHKLVDFISNSTSSKYVKEQSIPVKCVTESLGTLEGSGCAIINVLKEATQPSSLALLAAGEGSRLWGVSATNSFIKALTTVFDSTLLEQTINQSMYLLAKSPNVGKDISIVAGTDNVFLPSNLLRTANGKPFAEATDANFFFFSIEVEVFNESGEPKKDVLLALEQLGILLVDEKTSFPIDFLEKVSGDTVLEVLKKYNKKSVFYNCFVFGFTSKAKKLISELYSKKIKGTEGQEEKMFYECKDFDWSTHVLEPVSICSRSDIDRETKMGIWMERWKNGKIFSKENWFELFSIAEEFVSQCGAPVVVNLGSDTIWYDTGMCSDLFEMYQATIDRQSPKWKMLRSLLGLPHDTDNINSKINGEFQYSDNYFIYNSEFKKGGSIGMNSIVINSTFEEHTDVPDGCVVVNSILHSLSAPTGSISKVLIYSVVEQQKPLELKHDKAVYFSVFSEENTLSGIFPIDVVPKNKESTSYFDWYNVNDNKGKSYLEQLILGAEQHSFRTLQEGRVPSLELYLKNIRRN